MGARKALFVLTRCATVDEFVASFRVFCDGTSLFVPTRVSRQIGLEAPFSIQLADGTPVLSGVGIVLDVFTTTANVFNRPGLRLGISQLTPETVAVHARLQRPQRAASVRASSEGAPKLVRAPSSPIPTTRTTPADGTPVRAIEDLDLFDKTAPISIIGADGSAPLVDVSFVKPPTVTFATPAPSSPIPIESLDVPEEVIEPEPPAPPPARSSHKRQLIAVGAASAIGGAAIALALVAFLGRSTSPDVPTRTAPVAARTAAAPTRKPAPPPVTPAPPPAPAPKVEAAAAPAARCTLSIAAKPADAEIRVDGRLLGTSPAMFVGDCGAASVEVSRKRYATTTQTVTFDGNESQTLTVKLKRPARRVSAASAPSS